MQKSLKFGEQPLYKLGASPFLDQTPSEFAKTHLNLKISHTQRLSAKSSSNKMVPHYNNGVAPDSYDWRDLGISTNVKNQGSCGSCWAFSAIGNIEAQYQLKLNKSLTFSEQELVDCDKVDEGCNGGLMEDAFKYLETVGVESDADYEYQGTDGTCALDATKVKAKITGFHYAGTEDETQLKQLLFENGPFAIAMNATPLQFYFWGIFNPWFEFICNPKELNHGVLLVGYGVSSGTGYWIVKNSWGSYWGEKGYFRIIAGKGACGINTYVITAEVADN